MTVLERVNMPEDIKKLDMKMLEQLAQELREQIIAIVSKTGGHLAPNLGVVELTLSLFKVFDFPHDKIIWDVGHQAYVHKIITGRKDAFPGLRQWGKLSGFPKPEESIYDCFATGHSSTSISAALGMALARDRKGQKNLVLAVIGDGALTGGMAFEAMNHAGHLGTNLIVVLNDNEMSIAGNVGALSSYLTRMRTDPKYFKGKEEVEKLLRRLPAGSRVVSFADRFKESLKYLVVPGMLFEELGFTYLGPVDGHDLSSLNHVFQRAKRTKGPVLVHVLTKKGKGYQPAEKEPDRFHGIGPFDIESGKTLKKAEKPSYTDIFGSALVELAAKDEKIMAITAAMPEGTGLSKFAAVYPGRFWDVGIAEQHAVTLSAGLAAEGFHPVVAMYSTFSQRAFDQIIHDVAMQQLPVTLAIDRAGIVGEDGETHQGLYDLSFLRAVPNLVLMAPKDEAELRDMLFTAIQYPGPCALRYPRGTGEGVPLKDFATVPMGKAEVLKKGRDLTILAVGPVAHRAVETAKLLTPKGIDVEVINCRFVKPLDEDLILKSIQRTKKVIVIEENTLIGGFSSAILELIADQFLTDIRIVRIGTPDIFVKHGNAQLVKDIYGISIDGIIAAVGKLGFEIEDLRHSVR